jgi:hypothetical protein
MPHVIELFNELGLYSHISFANDIATLTITNIENVSESLIFSSPLYLKSEEKRDPMQLLGAAETYSRRYLWLMALDITESDGTDGTPSEEKNGKTPEEYRRESYEKSKENQAGAGGQKLTDKPTEKQLKRLFAMSKEANLTTNQMISLMKKHYNKVTDSDLNVGEYNDFCNKIQDLISENAAAANAPSDDDIPPPPVE